ncbi:MAG: hypothetical protein WBG69_07870 [Arcobacteraceae bacterium]
MYEYKERTQRCKDCSDNKLPLEHSLYHQTGLSSGIIHELNLTSVQDIEEAFQNAIQLSKDTISLDGRKTKIRAKNQFLYPKDIINMIPNLYFEVQNN